MTTYCEYSRTPEAKDVHKEHHEIYGYPLESDNELFARLCMEINQAGLNWETILKKEETLRKAYHNFNIETIAAYKEKDVKRLLADPGIIRNKLKIAAIIHNAQVIRELRKEHGSWKNWLDKQELTTKEEWVQLFKQTFKFTGGEITNEFVISTGYIQGAHDPDCEHYKQVLQKKPAWTKNIT